MFHNVYPCLRNPYRKTDYNRDPNIAEREWLYSSGDLHQGCIISDVFVGFFMRLQIQTFGFGSESRG